MRPRTLIVLAVLVLVLGAFIWFFERDLPSTEERAEKAKLALPVEEDEVTAVVIERSGARVRLARDAADREAASDDGAAAPAREWRLEEPLQARANRTSVDSLVSALTSLERERVLDEADPEAVGLAEPRATVTLETAEGEQTLTVGAEIPASSNMIVGHGGEVLVVSGYVWDQLDVEVDEWRSKDVFPPGRDRVERVELALADSEPVVLAKRGEDFWLESPIEDLADPDHVDELLGDLFAMKVESFVEGGGVLELDPVWATVSVFYDADEAPFRLELASPESGESGQRLARAGDQLVEVGEDLDGALTRGVAEWRSAAWTTLEVFEIDSLRVVDGDGEVLLERAGADWNRDGEKIEYRPVSDFLYALTGATGDRLLGRDEAESLGADLTRSELEVTLAGADREETLTVYDQADDGFVAGLASREALLLLPQPTVDDLRVKLRDIREAAPLAEETEAEAEG